jgi:hypothetical protein
MSYRVLLEDYVKLALIRLLEEVENDFENLESDDALNKITVLAHELPRRIRITLNAFRREQMSGLLHISGYALDQDRLGRTPAHWRDQSSPAATRREELILPIKGHEAAATTIGYIDSLDMPSSMKNILFENRFSIRPDESHLAKNNSAESAADIFAGIEEMQQNPGPGGSPFRRSRPSVHSRRPILHGGRPR